VTQEHIKNHFLNLSTFPKSSISSSALNISRRKKGREREIEREREIKRDGGRERERKKAKMCCCLNT